MVILDVLSVMLVGPMKKNHLSSTRSSVAGISGKEGTSTQSKGEVVPGSLIWVRLNGDSWWPAQVCEMLMWFWTLNLRIAFYSVAIFHNVLLWQRVHLLHMLSARLLMVTV